MKYLLMLLLLTLAQCSAAWGQTMFVERRGQRSSAEVTVMPLVEWYSDTEQTVRQSSLPVCVFIPLGRQVAVTMRTSAAASVGNDVTSLRGMSDVQTSVSYRQSVGEGSALLSMGLNVPYGKQKLSGEEFDTSLLLSRNFYDFSVSSLGQGFNVSSGGTWAHPLTDDLVVGAGASYLRKGAYQPLRDVEQNYTPGDEVLVTAGVDYRFSSTSSLAADLTYTWYAEDRWGDQPFKAGPTTTAAVQFLRYMGFDQLHVVMRYRNRAKSEVPLQLVGRTTRQQLLANHGEIAASYSMRLTGKITLTSTGQVRFYGDTVSDSAKYLGDFGLLPRFEVSERVIFLGRVVGTVGSFSGVEAGLGVMVQL